MKPVVSVITPLYQCEDHIEECIMSVVAQNAGRIEHIIIDNGSTDKGPEIVASLSRKYPHIKLLHCTTRGAGPARNMGIEQASGRYIAFLDADDVWAANKLSVQIERMKERKAGFSWTSYEVMNKEGTSYRMQKAKEHLTPLQHLMKIGTIGCLTAVYDQELLGKMFMNTMAKRQDFCLWYDILEKSRKQNVPVVGIPERLAFYRTHSDGISSNKGSAAQYQWKALREYVGLPGHQAIICFSSYALISIKDRLLPHKVEPYPNG